MVVLHHLSPAKRVECTVGATYVITTSGYIRSAGKSIENGLSVDLFEGGCNLAVNDTLLSGEFFVDIKTSSFNVVATTNQNRAFSWGFNLYGNISGGYATGGASPYTDPSFNEIRGTDVETGELAIGRTADELIAFIQARKTADPLMRNPTGGDISFNAACMYPYLEYHNNLNLGPYAVMGGERVI
jgi:hypothetical protein